MCKFLRYFFGFHKVFNRDPRVLLHKRSVLLTFCDRSSALKELIIEYALQCGRRVNWRIVSLKSLEISKDQSEKEVNENNLCLFLVNVASHVL